MQQGAPAIEIRQLRKVFHPKGSPPVTALDGVSLTVGRGEIFGFLGRNGAGKTTAVKVLTNMIADYEGECRIQGLPTGSLDVRRVVGLLPEVTDFHAWLTAEEILWFHGRLHGLSKAVLSERVPALLGRLGIERDAWTRRVGPFSQGMLQRLGIAVALVGDPEIVFLDEPTANLDPLGRRDVRNLLLELEREGRTVFLNSHLLSDVEMTCHRVAILEQGRIVASGDVSELAQLRPYAHIRATGVPGALLDELRTLSDDVAVLDGTIVVRIRTEDDLDPIPSMVERHGARLRYLAVARESLEDVFMRMVGSPGAQSGGGTQ